MFALLLPLAGSLLKSKIFPYLLLAAAAVIAFFSYTAYIEHKAKAEVLAQEKAATDAESARRLKSLQDTQDYYRPYVEALTKSEKANADLIAQGKRASARNDHQPCLDTATSDRVLQIGRGRQGGHGADKPAGKAAR